MRTELTFLGYLSLSEWGGAVHSALRWRCGELYCSQQGVACDVPVKLLLININNARGFIHRMINLMYRECNDRMADGKKNGDKKSERQQPPFTSFTGRIKSAMIADIPGS